MARNKLGQEVPPRSLDYDRLEKKSRKPISNRNPPPAIRAARAKRKREERQSPVRQFEVRLQHLTALEAQFDLGVVGAWDRLLDYRTRCEAWAMETCDCTWDELVEEYNREYDDAA